VRRRNELMDKLRVKILQDRKDGLTYAQIEHKRGVSSRTIADLVKDGDPQRFCQQCGETDPEKLEEHHTNRVNRPNYTITLCANCHSKVTRKEQQKRNREKKSTLAIPETVSSFNLPIPQTVPIEPQVTNVALRPFTSQEKRWIGKGALYSGGGVALGEGLFDSRLSWWARLLLGIGGSVSLYIGSKI